MKSSEELRVKIILKEEKRILKEGNLYQIYQDTKNNRALVLEQTNLKHRMESQEICTYLSKGN